VSITNTRYELDKAIY